MAIQVRCRHCGEGFLARNRYADREIECPYCRSKVAVAGEHVSDPAVYITYAPQDKSIAAALAERLGAAAITSTLEPRDSELRARGCFDPALHSRAVVVVFSLSTVAETEVMQDVRDATSHNVPVIPFRIDDTEPSAAFATDLKQSEWIDASIALPQDHYNEVVSRIATLIGPADPTGEASASTSVATSAPPQYIGIDLGTTYSAMGCLDRHGRVTTIHNDLGRITTPSVVMFEDDGRAVIGQEAKQAALADPERVADAVKRDMGERHYNKMIAGSHYSPATLSALILKKLKQDAQASIGPIGGAVITVPAYFNEARRRATINAGELAGLNVIDILNEPTAAALAFAYEHASNLASDAREAMRLVEETHQRRHVVVYDLGGGTFDVTVLRITGFDVEVLGTDGDVGLGGIDWDNRIVQYAADAFETEHGVDPQTNPATLQNMRWAAEEAKMSLTQRNVATVLVNHLGMTQRVRITRQTFEEITSDLLYRTESRLVRVLRSAKLSWEQVDDVLMVGGSTRMPMVPEMLERVTAHTPIASSAPDEIVAHGAAIHAAMRVMQAAGPKPEKSKSAAGVGAETDTATADDSSDANIGMASMEMAPVTLSANEDVSKAPTTLPPPLMDDAVTDLLRSIRAKNVTAHSLGVVSRDRTGKLFNKIVIPQNASLPASMTRRFRTAVEDQPSLKVILLEGESENIEECVEVGVCRIEPLPPKLKRGAAIDVTFDYDHSGQITVCAIDTTYGTKNEMTIERSRGMRDALFERSLKAIKKMNVR